MSLQEYSLVSQDKLWVGKTFEAPEDVLKYNSIECGFPLRDIYPRFVFGFINGNPPDTIAQLNEDKAFRDIGYVGKL